MIACCDTTWRENWSRALDAPWMPSILNRMMETRSAIGLRPHDLVKHLRGGRFDLLVAQRVNGLLCERNGLCRLAGVEQFSGSIALHDAMPLMNDRTIKNAGAAAFLDCPSAL